MIEPKRIIILDWAVYLHKAVFALKFNPTIPATYTAVSMILGTFKRIGIDPDDTVLVACDGRKSWRKEIETAYKGNRKAHREEAGVDWDHWFQKFDELREYLTNNTNWQFVGPIRGIEADDIAAVACRYFKNTEKIVLCTVDSDWEQLWSVHPGVEIFSLQTKKWKLKPENYNVYTELAKKIKKETSDNLVSEVITDKDYDNRFICVDLTKLPDWVEQTVKDEFDKLEYKNIGYERVPFKSLQSRLGEIYNISEDYISYPDYVDKVKKQEEKIKLRKQEAKEKEKRKKLREEKKILKLIEKEKVLSKKGDSNGKVRKNRLPKGHVEGTGKREGCMV